MNYYIIPKNKINPKFRLLQTEKKISPYISPSATINLDAIFYLIQNEKDKDKEKDNIEEIINPLQFVHSHVPGTQLSVSKLKSNSNILFEMMEIFQLCDLMDLVSGPPCIPLKIASIAENYESIMDYINIVRDGHNDIVLSSKFNYNDIIENYIDLDLTNDSKYHLLLIEYKMEEYTNLKQYVLNLLASLYLVLTIKAKGGICIIKLGDITNKVAVEIIHIINSLFLKTYLIKPNICNVTVNCRYLVCSYFNHYNDNIISIKDDLKRLIKNINYDLDIESIIENNIPNYFLNKLEELNAIVYQQQLESLDQTINVSRNKNKEDKLEVLKRNHIQKCIQWCEKNQIPHNKFIDKTNIFLNAKKEL